MQSPKMMEVQWALRVVRLNGAGGRGAASWKKMEMDRLTDRLYPMKNTIYLREHVGKKK